MPFSSSGKLNNLGEVEVKGESRFYSEFEGKVYQKTEN